MTTAYYIGNRQVETAEDQAYLDQSRPVELYSTGLPGWAFDGTPPNVQDEEFVEEYGSLREAMDAADAMGLGVYLTSTPADGKYTGMIRVVQGTGPAYRTL